jgi:hypothetical protein
MRAFKESAYWRPTETSSNYGSQFDVGGGRSSPTKRSLAASQTSDKGVELSLPSVKPRRFQRDEPRQ